METRRIVVCNYCSLFFPPHVTEAVSHPEEDEEFWCPRCHRATSNIHNVSIILRYNLCLDFFNDPGAISYKPNEEAF